MSEWTQERIDDFLKGYAMFGDTEACEAGNEIIRLRARIADLEAAGDELVKFYKDNWCCDSCLDDSPSHAPDCPVEKWKAVRG